MGHSQDIVWCQLIGSLECVNEVGLMPCQLAFQGHSPFTRGKLTSIPKVGMRVKIWKNRQKVKNSPAIIMTVKVLQNRGCCATVWILPADWSSRGRQWARCSTFAR